MICYIFSFLGLPTQQQQLNNKKPEELWFKNVHSFDMDHCKNVTSFCAPNQVINGSSTHTYSVLSRTLDRKPSLEFGFEEEKFKSSRSIEFLTYRRRRTEIFRTWGQNSRVD